MHGEVQRIGTPNVSRGALGHLATLLAEIAVLSAAYFCAGKLGLTLAFLNQNTSAVWPPTGLSLAALLLFGSRLWPGIWLGAFLVNMTTAGSTLTSMGIATGNTLEVLAGVWLVERFAGGRRAFEHARDVFRFFLLAGVLSTVISASFGATSLALGGLLPRGDYLPVWATWWLGDMASAAVVTPLLVIWGRMPVPRWSRGKLSEALLVLAVTLLISRLIFEDVLPVSVRQYAQSFMCIPPLLWATYSFRQRGAITATAVLSGIAIWGTARGLGPLALPDRNSSLLLLQSFIITMGVSNLVLGALVSERRRGEVTLRKAQELEQGRAAQLQAIMQAVPAVIWIAHDPGCRVISGNQAAQELLRLPHGENASKYAPLGERPANFTVLKDGRELRPEELPVQRAAHGEEVRDFEEEVRFNDGTIRHLFGNATPLRDTQGRLCGSVGAFVDITGRKAAEAELEGWRRELEARVAQRTVELAATHAQLRVEIEERQRLETEIARAVEREQLRLGQELHDGLGQQLAGIALMIAALEAKLEKLSPARAREAGKLGTMVQDSVEQTRNLAKGFYPVELETYGLRVALLGLGERAGRRSRVRYEVESNGDSSCTALTGPLAIQLFRIAQEAVLNAFKHAAAKNVKVRLAHLDGRISLTVEDDGVGLPPNVSESRGMGLRIMQHRARIVGGKLELGNRAQGGVAVTCSVPVAELCSKGGDHA